MSYFDLGSGDHLFNIDIAGGPKGVFNLTTTLAERDINQHTLDLKSEVRATFDTIENHQKINYT